jgi:hypothetical protein
MIAEVTQIINAVAEATVAILQGVGMFRRNRPQPAPPARVNNSTKFMMGMTILALTTAATQLGAALIIHHGLVRGGNL